jgi:hypothetical protein
MKTAKEYRDSLPWDDAELETDMKNNFILMECTAALLEVLVEIRDATMGKKRNGSK